MFKTLLNRIRGKVASDDASDERHPLLVADRQRIDAEGRVDLARRRLALAQASRQAEVGRLTAADRRIAALEFQAARALADNRLPTARQSAQLIARLSADREWTAGIVRAADAEAARLARNLAAAEAQLARVRRAGRIIRAEEVVRQLRANTARRRGFDAAPDAPLVEAEATLARLRARQAESLATEVHDADRCETVGKPPAALPAPVPGAAEILLALRNRVTMARRAA